MGKDQHRFHVLRVKDTFNGDRLWLMFLDQLFDALLQVQQAG